MVDPHRGLETESIYRIPINAILAHPSILLGLAGFGFVLALGAPELCRRMYNQFTCSGNLRTLGIGIAAVGLVGYLGLRLASGRFE